MNVLFITGSLNQGGAEYQLLELAKLFQDKGHSVEVFAITDYDFYLPFIEKNELAYTHLYNTQNKIARIWATVKKVRTAKPDLVISYLKSVSQVALFATKFSGVNPRIIVGERTSLVLGLHDWYYFNLMRLSNFITFNSVSKLEYVNNRFPKLKGKTVFFPNIIDTNKFAYLEKDYLKTNLTIGYVGRVSPEKNVSSLVKALKIVSDTNLQFEFLVFGDCRHKDYFDEIQILLEDSNLKDRVHFKGKTDNVYQAYQQIDLLCLISDYEGFSNVIAEALCCGLPVVTSDVPENRYLIENQVNGFVVDQKNPQAIAAGILAYQELSPDKKLEMAKNNVGKAKSIFDRDKIYDGYLALIQ